MKNHKADAIKVEVLDKLKGILDDLHIKQAELIELYERLENAPGSQTNISLRLSEVSLAISRIERLRGMWG